MNRMRHLHLKRTIRIALATIAIPLPSAAADVINTEHYSIQIEHPGFRITVATHAGVALPAAPDHGLSFLDNPTTSATHLSQTENTTVYRVANSGGHAALVPLTTAPHVITWTVALGNTGDSHQLYRLPLPPNLVTSPVSISVLCENFM